jgi:dolichol-phosphate mannosyltransferase
MKPIVVVPTYNERENLPKLVEQIRRQPGNFHILIVDDNSPDGTGDVADDLGRLHPGEVLVLHRQVKQGLGRAYVAAFQHILASDLPYDMILQMDADLSHDPSYLPDFLKAIENNDLVLGSRYITGINVVNWDFKRLILSKIASKYVQIITGMRYSDITGGFKCWRRRALEAIDLDKVHANGYLFQMETTYRAHLMKLRIGEIPIIFYERNLGRSKIDVNIITEALWGVVRLRLMAALRPLPRPAAEKLPGIN